MKIMQILDSEVYCDLTPLYPNIQTARQCYSSEIQIEETPDYVFPGWGYNASKEGDERFIKPVPSEGWEYDDDTGTFWNPEQTRMAERTQKHAETTNDTMEAYRKLRSGSQEIDWQAWLDTLDEYNVEIEKTQLQEGYPLKVTYPEYPTKPQPISLAYLSDL